MPDWEIQLLNTNNMSLVGDISELPVRSLDLVYNGAGAYHTSIPMSHELAHQTVAGKYSILCRRDGVDIWSGPIWTREGDFSTGRINLTAVGWIEALDKRLLQAQKVYNTGQTDAVIAYDLISTINSQDPSHPLWVTSGSAVGTFQTRQRKYEISQPLGTALKELSQLEAGFDIFIDPRTRAVNLRAWDLYPNHPEVIYDTLKGITFQEDASRYFNRIYVTGATGVTPAVADDVAAQVEYGLFEYSVALSDVKDANILAAYANAEIAIQARPPESGVLGTVARPPFNYNIVPEIGKQYFDIPGIFDDWQLGDKIYFSVDRSGYGVDKQAIRVFRVSLDLSGGEKITQAEVKPE